MLYSDCSSFAEGFRSSCMEVSQFKEGRHWILSRGNGEKCGITDGGSRISVQVRASCLYLR